MTLLLKGFSFFLLYKIKKERPSKYLVLEVQVEVVDALVGVRSVELHRGSAGGSLWDVRKFGFQDIRALRTWGTGHRELWRHVLARRQAAAD